MRILRVKHVRDYILDVSFRNGIKKRVDLENFLKTERNPMTTQFLDIERFKKVKISYGSTSWEDGQMDIYCDSLYNWELL